MTMFLCIRFFLLQQLRVVIGAGAIAAAFGNRFRALHHEGAAGFAVTDKGAFFAGRARLDRMLAVGIVGTAVEGTEATALFDHFSLPADGTGDAGRLRCRSFDEFAFRIVATRDESAEAAGFFDERAAAVRAGLTGFFVFGNKGTVFGTQSLAVGKARATIEGAVFAEFQHHAAVALRAMHALWRVAQVGDFFHFFFGLHFFNKGRIEVFQCFFVLELAV